MMIDWLFHFQFGADTFALDFRGRNTSIAGND